MKKAGQAGVAHLILLILAVSIIVFLLISQKEFFKNIFPRFASFAATSYNCTQIIGFSQTYQWFYGMSPDFKTVVGPNWQLKWQSGATIDGWADPTFSGWNAAPEQPCPQSSVTPDRTLLTITGDYQSDVSWWVTQIRATINNIHTKYPSVTQIILQPVVGGPNGTQCPDSTAPSPYIVNRASYNFAYINQAISQVVGPGVVAGYQPTVTSCTDYADWVGHLQDSVRGSMAIKIGNYYNGVSPSTTPGPTSSPTPAPTPIPNSMTVTFDDTVGQNRVLNGQYPTGVIDWGSDLWFLSGPWGLFTTKSFSFNGPGSNQAAFNFLSPRRFYKFDAFNGDTVASTLTISCPTNPSFFKLVNPFQMVTVSSNWSNPCPSVTLNSSNGWDTNFDNLVIDATASGSPIPSPTPTPTPTPTATPSPTPTPTPPGSRTLGNTHIGATVDSSDSNFMDGSKITVGSAEIVAKSISVYVDVIDSSTSNRSYQVAIYNDSGGSPGTLLAKSATGTLVANSWNTLSISATLSANTSYWLMYNTNGRTISVNNIRIDPGAAGQGAYSSNPVTFGTWPAPFPFPTIGPWNWSIYLSY